MELEKRIALLKTFYAIHEEALAGLKSKIACRRQCAACCTCNVTCTTLEGWLVFDHLRQRGGTEAIARMVAAAPASRYRPVLTLNHMVDLCVRGEEVPEEINDPGAGTCALLDDQLCSLYEVRPLGCRAMLSATGCDRGGEACMPPFALTLINVMMQYLEGIDRPGGWGNLMDVLAFFTDAGRLRDYENRISQCLTSPLLSNRGFDVLMVPPEHRERMRPVLGRLQAAIAKNASP